MPSSMTKSKLLSSAPLGIIQLQVYITGGYKWTPYCAQWDTLLLLEIHLSAEISFSCLKLMSICEDLD